MRKTPNAISPMTPMSRQLKVSSLKKNAKPRTKIREADLTIAVSASIRQPTGKATMTEGDSQPRLNERATKHALYIESVMSLRARLPSPISSPVATAVGRTLVLFGRCSTLTDTRRRSRCGGCRTGERNWSEIKSTDMDEAPTDSRGVRDSSVV